MDIYLVKDSGVPNKNLSQNTVNMKPQTPLYSVKTKMIVSLLLYQGIIVEKLKMYGLTY